MREEELDLTREEWDEIYKQVEGSGMIDINELRQALRTMKPHQTIYKVVRDELKARGNWKYRSRGKDTPKASK